MKTVVKSQAVEWGWEMRFLGLWLVIWKMGRSEGEVMVIPPLPVTREGRGHRLELRSEQGGSCDTWAEAVLLFGGWVSGGGLGQVSGTRLHGHRS